NTPGGAVVITSNAPTKNFEASIQQTIGNRGTLRTDGYINIPLGPDFSMRIAGNHSETNGYITDVVTGKKMNHENHDAIRASFLVDPDNGLESLFIFEYFDVDDGMSGSFARPGSMGGADQETRDMYHVASGVPVYARAEILGMSNKTNIELTDEINLRNILGYRDMKYSSLSDSDGSNLFLLPINRYVKQWQISEEIQLLGEHDWGNWIGGVYYFHEESDNQGMSTGVFGGCGAISEDFTITNFRDYSCYSNTWGSGINTSTAVFAQATVNLGIEGLTATVGGRMNWDKRQAIIKNRTHAACRFTLDDDNDPATPEVRPSLQGCALDMSKSYSEPTYNISLEYKANNDLLLYVAHRHGYRTGGYGARASTQAGLSRTYRPEIVDDAEIGMKAEWHMGDVFMRTNLAAFYVKYKDIQRQIQDDTTLPVTTVVYNAQKARVKGFELEAMIRPVQWFELSGY
ncbi:MAG: TonB-dependent receptor, partial [Sphingomonadaceae bacterium]